MTRVCRRRGRGPVAPVGRWPILPRVLLFGALLIGVACTSAPAAPPAPTAPAAAAPAAAPTTAPAAAAKPPAAAPTTAPSAPAAAKSGPKTITIGDWQEVPILNTLMTSQRGNVLSSTKLTLRGLLFTDDKGEFEGELAEQVPSFANGGISQDGRTITYKLRRGVTWHDGKPVTSADVKFTWQAIMKPEHKVATRAGYDQIADVETPDDQTVVVRFKAPFAGWRLLFDVLMPKHVLENEADFNGSQFHHRPIGFGPYKVVENVKGDHITWEAFDNYWRGRPKIDRIFFRQFANTDALIQALKAKEIDLARMIPLSNIPELRGLESQGITTLVVPDTLAERYGLNQKHPLLADKQLRKALALAVDYKAIVDKLLFGLATQARGDWDNTPWENTSLKPVEHNPDEAKRILDALGWVPGPDGIRMKDGKRLALVNTTTTGSQLRENVQLLTRENLRAIGVEMTIQNAPTAQLFGSYAAGGTWVRGEYEMGGWGTGITQPDPDLSVMYVCKEIASPENPNGGQRYQFCNPEVDALFAQQATEMDPDRRKAIFFKIQEIVREEYVAIFLYNQGQSWGLQTRVKNADRTLKTPFGAYHWRIEEWDVE